MAKPRKTAPSAGTPVLSDDDTHATPAPPATLHVTPWTLSGKQALHRVHSDQYRADEFNPGLQGLSWISRQDDSARAVVLFGDRIPKGALQQVGDSRSLLQDEHAYAELLDLADRIGVDITPGK